METTTNAEYSKDELVRELEHNKEVQTLLYEELDRQRRKFADDITSYTMDLHSPIVIKKSRWKRIKERFRRIFGGQEYYY